LTLTQDCQTDVLPAVGIPFAYLIYLLGWSAIASLAILVVLTPIVRYFSRSVFRMSRKIPVQRDKRVSIVKEMLQSVTAIKLNAWEAPLMQKAASAREEELR
jgi:ABC-type bacteriocin/lantibiotic exporter with double-glycine peptidase domain